MDDGALRAHVAYSAGQQKSPRVMTGAGTVVELMRRAGVIEEVDGKYMSVLDVPSSASSASNTEAATRVELRTGKLAIVRNSQDPGINISISIEVDCKPEDLEGLGARLRRVVDEFNSTEEVQAGKSVEGSDGSSDQ